MANAFVPGQRLTAADLNSLAQLAVGPANPSDSYNWTQTSSGKLNVPWDNFHNSKNVNPQPLDVEVSIQQLDTALSSGQVHGLRRVFMNTGFWTTTYEGAAGQTLPIGRLNNVPFIGLLGWQSKSRQSIRQQEGVNFSLWSYYGNVPTDLTDNTQWNSMQKLYQENVCRNSSLAHWWWTGITLEDCSKLWMTLGWPMDIVAYPLLVDVQKTADGEDAPHKTYAVLVVSTKLDYMLKTALTTDGVYQLLAANIQTYYGSASTGDFKVKRLYFLDDETLVQTLATFNYQPTAQDCYYKQQSNFVQFWKDWSAEKILEVDSEHATYNNGILQWIDGSGKHHCELLNDIDVQEGSQEDSKLPVALAIAWNPKTKEKLLSCVNVNYDVLYGEDIQDAILSGLFKEISADNPSKRLLWIDPCDGKDFVYFDPCPNFMQGGGGSLELSARKYDVSPYIAPPYAHLDGEMSVVLSSRADSNVQADIVQLSSGLTYINFGVYYV